MHRFERLRTWRTQRARERAVPAYVILPDRSLVELSRRLPASDSELLAVSGVGAAKLALYGPDLLRICAQMRAETQVAST
jgi:superfamily II DNA helicase RecQ